MKASRNLAGRFALECETNQDELVASLILRLAERGLNTLDDSKVRTLLANTLQKLKGV